MEKFKKIETTIEGLYIIEPMAFGDARGFFMESYSERDFIEIGIADIFVQDDHLKLGRGILRGLHFQKKQTHSKLVRVTSGAILDVVVDMRSESSTYGGAFSVELSAENKRMLYIPPRFAHGFMTVEKDTVVISKCSDYYDPKLDDGIMWNDPVLCIDWQFERYNIDQKYLNISGKDKKHPAFHQLDPRTLWK